MTFNTYVLFPKSDAGPGNTRTQWPGPASSDVDCAFRCVVVLIHTFLRLLPSKNLPETVSQGEQAMEVTTLAIEKLKEVMEEQGEASGSLRVVAIPAETGGLQYMLTMENESQADDTVLAMDGVKFLMDSDSAPFLEEATIDYVENLGGQVGFVINNPMFSSAGGCGSGCGCGSGGGGGCGGGGGGCGCGGGGCGGH
ncbi:MAG: iron-sulfur cluster assembly accessory protein [SAR202 cluster bacterium]|nr:iron-sulfur cluster assembly accessory protein [SAR202 cluster bacterium]